MTTVDAASVTPSTGKADFNVDGAVCLRELFTGTGATATTVRQFCRQSSTNFARRFFWTQ